MLYPAPTSLCPLPAYIGAPLIHIWRRRQDTNLRVKSSWIRVVVFYVRTDWFVSSINFLFLGCSFTEECCTFGSVGLPFSICHSRFPPLSPAKAAKLSWYCLFRCVGLLFPISHCRLRSLIPAKAAEQSWYCFSGVFSGVLFLLSTTAGSVRFRPQRQTNYRGFVVSGVRACSLYSTATDFVRFLSATVTGMSWHCTFGYSLGLRLFTRSSVMFSSTTGPACFFNRRLPNCRGIVPSRLFAIG